MTYVDGPSRWAGRVYDGPLEGEHHVKDRPYFEANWSPRSSFGVSLTAPPDAYFYRMAYRWSNPLRAWVFDWRTAPQPKPRAGND